MKTLPHLSILLALTAVAPAQTVVVDGAGGGQYTEIRDALANVPSGAILLVRYSARGYLPFTIANRSVTIVGIPTTIPALSPFVDIAKGSSGVRIGPLSAGDRVILEALHFDLSKSIAGAPLEITGARGSVSMNWCSFSAAPNADFRVPIESSLAVGWTACVARSQMTNPGTSDHWLFRIARSRVAFHDCNFSGRDSSSPALPGAPAIDATQSRIAIHDSTFVGGRGHSGAGTDGGPPVVLRSGSTLFAAGRATWAVLRGGTGGTGTARDGDGLVVTGGSSARIEGYAPEAGNGSKPVVVDSSSVATVNRASQPPVHRIEAAPRPGNTVLWSVDAPGGSPLLLLAGFEPVFVDVGVLGPLRVAPIVSLPVTTPGLPPLLFGAKIPVGTPVGTHLVTQFLNLSGGQVWASNAMVTIVRN